MIFLDNLEWIAKLHDTPETFWISRIQLWQNAKNLLLIASIKDMELLKKYHFGQTEIFVGNPTAEEIKYAYLRYLLRNASGNYDLDMQVLDEIAQSMSVGKKTQILKAVENFRNSDENRRALKGFILTGPPGMGKTMIAKALANREKCYFMSPTLADLKGEYIGHSSAKVKRVFAEARGNAPTILFIDEADTVFPSRALGSGDKDSFTLDMVNQFLQEVDGSQTGEQRIFTIAATNRPEAIDSAIKSRLSREPIRIRLPTKEMRRLIFNDNLLQGGDTFRLDGKFFEDQVLSKSDSMSGRDIANFVTKLKTFARNQGIKLGNNNETRNLFDVMFQQREEDFIEELTSLGIFSRENIVSPPSNKLRLSSIIGYDNLKDQIALQVDYIRADQAQKKRYEDFKIVPQKGVLMYEPPGNGKSILAKAVAGEYGFYFFKVLSRDEFDSLVGNDILNGVVRGSLLIYISDETGLRSKRSKILFMAATNFYDKLDEAVKRQGRIDAHLLIDNPTEENGRRIEKKVSRPSGAELGMLYKELKEAAFRQDRLDGNRLVIDDGVLSKRFPK